jgi:rRNA maturation endonuclease Nob1
MSQSMNNDKVTITHIRYLCASCQKELIHPKRGCLSCGSKKFVPKMERNTKEEWEVGEILEGMKGELLTGPK